jgi:repressor LexA
VGQFGLTPRQLQVLEFIRSYIAEHTYSPTYQEIGSALGINSKSMIHHIIRRLADRGAIIRLPGRARSITVVSA